jgi:hypothetical protein
MRLTSPSDDPCSFLSSAISNGRTATIFFSESIPSYFISSLSNYFGYSSMAFGLPLIVRPGVPKLIEESNRSLKLHFPLPFVQNYSGHLFCVNPRSFFSSAFNIPRNVLPEVDNYVPLDFSVGDFDGESQWSQMKCYGATFETRFCEMRKISIYRQLFVFATEVDFVFPEPFLSSGARAAPFDRAEGRLIYEPIVVQTPLEMVSSETVYVKELSYVMARFYNSRMLWHMTFDFLVPAFSTFGVVEGKDLSRHRRIFLRDHEYRVYPELLRAMTDEPIVDLLSDNTTRTFERVVVGLVKWEKDPSAARGGDAMFGIRYGYTGETAPMLRAEVLRAFKMKPPSLNPSSPVVLIGERKTKSRVFLNIDEIEEYILSRCDFCEIQRVNFEGMPISKQIEMAAQATVYIGAHGSGLSHVLWMQEHSLKAPTAMVEIFPHGYGCRDWFESAAAVAGVKYYRTMSSRKGVASNSAGIEKLSLCWERPEQCATAMCHDILRDQNISLDIGAFSSIWMEILGALKLAREGG